MNEINQFILDIDILITSKYLNNLNLIEIISKYYYLRTKINTLYSNKIKIYITFT